MKRRRGRARNMLLAVCMFMLGMIILPGQPVKVQAAASVKIQNGWEGERLPRRYYRDGQYLTGWQTIGGNRYYFNKNGYNVSGWQILGGQRYYFNQYGRAQTGFTYISGQVFYLNQYGRALTGWQTINGKRYYLNNYGRVMTGWQQIGNYRYYLDPNKRYILTGWQTINGKRYYLNSYGRALTGWQTIGNYRYYLHTKYGYAFTGWQTIGGNLYYFEESSGRAATGTRVINGERYTFNSYGRVISSTSTNPVVSRAVLFGYETYGSSENDQATMCGVLLKTGYSSIGGNFYLSKAQVKAEIEKRFAAADSNDVSLVYYSGKGSPDGSIYLVNGESISMAELAGWLQKIPGNIIVMLECDYSGSAINKSANSASFNENVIQAFRSADRVVEKSGELSTGKFTVMTACSKTETTSYHRDTGNNYFTEAISYGAGFECFDTYRLPSAPADTNHDDKLTVSELSSYAYQYCRKYQTVCTYTTNPNLRVLQR